MKELEALARIRAGHLVIREKQSRWKGAPVRRDVLRVNKAERGRFRAGAYWFNRSGECLKPGLTSRVRPLTREVVKAAPELASSPFADEIAALGADFVQFKPPEGFAGLLAGDVAYYEMANGQRSSDRVQSVTPAFVYVGPYYFNRETGEGQNTRGRLCAGS
jgi:hypothetical protein